MSERYEARLIRGGWAVWDTEKKQVTQGPFMTRRGAEQTAWVANTPLPEPCCDSRDYLERYARVLEHYRVALAHISRTSSDVETQELALDTIQQAQRMLRGETT